MVSQQLLAFVALASIAFVAADGIDSAVYPCQTCTAGNFEDSSQLPVAFCYTSGQCQQATETTLWAPCGVDSNSGILPFSYGMNGDCDCYSNVVANDGTCDSCASSTNPGCVFVETGRLNIDLRADFAGGARFATSKFMWTNNTCRSANSFGAASYIVTTALGQVTLTLNPQADAWYWGQCTLPGISFVAVIVAAVVLAVGILACCCRALVRHRQAKAGSKKPLLGVTMAGRPEYVAPAVKPQQVVVVTAQQVAAGAPPLTQH